MLIEGDRTGIPPGEPDEVRPGVLRRQLLQAPDLDLHGLPKDGVPRQRHPGVRKHRQLDRSAGRQVLRREGLLLREFMEPHAAAQDRILSAVPEQGELAGRCRAKAGLVRQCRDVRARAQRGDLRKASGRSREHSPHHLRGTGLVEQFLQGRVRADPAGVQPPTPDAVVAPRECGAGEGEGRPLLCGWVEAVEVHGEGGEHGQGGREDAGEQVVGRVRRQVPGLQEEGGDGGDAVDVREQGDVGGEDVDVTSLHQRSVGGLSGEAAAVVVKILYLCMYVCMYVRTYVCMHVCMYSAERSIVHEYFIVLYCIAKRKSVSEREGISGLACDFQPMISY